jgi:hypothetical protein
MPASVVALRRRRQALVERLPSLAGQVVRGSVIERYLPCGKPGCRCASGRGHGPKYYLSVSYPQGRSQLQYLAREQRPEVQMLVQNLHRVRQLLERICDINRELLRRQEKV